MDRECFNHIVKDSASKKRERFEETLKHVELLDSMDPYERIHLADGIRDVKYQAGEYVIREVILLLKQKIKMKKYQTYYLKQKKRVKKATTST